MADNAKWYVVHTYSGYENTVAASIEKAVENRGLRDLIQEVSIPLETVTEITDNGPKTVERKVFPGYVLVKMVMTDDTWHLVRNIRGATGFVGSGNKAIPLTDEEIAALGVAPFIMQSTESLVTVVLNVGAQKYGGDLYVASITILQSVMQVIVMPTNGITTGVQPIMSYNYGAKNYARVRAVFRRLLTVTLTVTTAAFLLVALFPTSVALLFNDDPQLVSLVGRVRPLFFGDVWAFGAQVACQSTFMALGQAKTSLFLALLRKIILLVPLAILLPRLTGSVMGLYAAEPVADFLASATTLTLFLKRRKHLLPVGEQTENG